MLYLRIASKKPSVRIMAKQLFDLHVSTVLAYDDYFVDWAKVKEVRFGVLSTDRKLTVMSLFLLWIVWITRVISREHHFVTGIAWGTIPSGFPVFGVVVTGCSRNNYGKSPNLWVQKKLTRLRRSTKNAWLRPTEFFGKFSKWPSLQSLQNPGRCILEPFLDQVCYATDCSL